MGEKHKVLLASITWEQWAAPQQPTDKTWSDFYGLMNISIEQDGAKKDRGKTSHMIIIPSCCKCMSGPAGRLTADCQSMTRRFPIRLSRICNFIEYVPEEGQPRPVIRYNGSFKIAERTDGQFKLRNFSRSQDTWWAYILPSHPPRLWMDGLPQSREKTWQ